MHDTQMGDKEKFILSFGEKENLKALGIDWNIQLDMIEIKWDSMDWINVAQGSGQWCAFVNKVMSLKVLKKIKDFDY
jgi:hypothetical protein